LKLELVVLGLAIKEVILFVNSLSVMNYSLFQDKDRLYFSLTILAQIKPDLLVFQVEKLKP